MGLEHAGVHLCGYGAFAFYFATSELATRTAFRWVKLDIELSANLYNKYGKRLRSWSLFAN